MKRITVTGNIGRDPETRMDPSGNQFVTFSVGIIVGSKQHPRTDWVEVSCNGKLAEIAATYAKKGNKVLVDGFPHVNAYINKENTPVATQRIYAHVIELLNRVSSQGDDVSGVDSVVYDEATTANLHAEDM